MNLTIYDSQGRTKVSGVREDYIASGAGVELVGAPSFNYTNGNYVTFSGTGSAENFDHDNSFDPVTSDRLICRVAGTFEVKAALRALHAGGTYRRVHVVKNNLTTLEYGNTFDTNNGANPSLTFHTNLSVGDYLQLQVGTDVAGAQAWQYARISMERVSPVASNPIPIGGCIDYYGFTEPSDGNWKFPTNQELPIATYPDAYAILTSNGTIFPHGANTNGAGGAGSTHFRTPDKRGRMSLTLDNMGGTDAGRLSMANTLGATGGVESALIALTEIPDHAHQPGNGGMNSGGAASSTPDLPLRSSTSPDPAFRTGSGIYASGTYNSAARGTQTNLSKLPPYTLVNELLRVR